MTLYFQELLHIIGIAINNIEGDCKEEINIKAVRDLAISQGVWTLVYPVLEQYADVKEYLQEFMQMVAMGIQKTTFQLHTIAELNNAGFKACLLKGASVAALYPHPEYRISGDTDILIKPEEEKEIIKFLEQNGYTVEQREKNDHHFKAYHPVGGLLEGHVRLYSIPTEKIILDGLALYNEEFLKMKIEGYAVPVLGLNDGLMYLTAHYIKHLVNEGGGIRQMLDLLIYMEHYKNELDFRRYYSVMKQLRYYKLIEVIQAIGAKYWGFNYPMKHEQLVDKILSDSEEGGIFGFDAMCRNGFYSEYCKKRCSGAKAQTLMYFKSEVNFIRRLFPSKAHMMMHGYTCAHCSALLPMAYIHRMVDKLLKWDRTRKSNESGIAERLKLMRELGMI